MRVAVAFVREAGGLLRVEDVLPLFPDFVTIDNFQVQLTCTYMYIRINHVFGNCNA